MQAGRGRVPGVPRERPAGRFYGMRRRWMLWLLLILVMTAPGGILAEQKRLFRIGTGGMAGVYYPIGKLIAHGLTASDIQGEGAGPGESGVPYTIAVAQSSGGSVANVQALAAGEIEAGMVQADVAAWAYNGVHDFAGDERARGVRAVASLYPENFQLVVRGDAGIHRVPDCRGKRISIDEPGSGTLAVTRIVLEAYGLTETDLSPVYLKPHLIGDRLARGDLQGFVIMAGFPAEVVHGACDQGFSIVPIDQQTAARINARHPHLVPGVIPEGIYPGVPETPTVQVHALLVVSEAATPELVYQITQALWSRRTMGLLREGHPQGLAITLETALHGLTIPLHPGAARFYREQGITEPKPVK